MPAMQTPRTHGHPTDAIADKPAPTEPAQAVGAGLARDTNAAHSQAPHRRHRRQASSNRARATCRSRACPRCSHRELTDTPPTPSQASLPVGAGLARDAGAAHSRIPHRRYRRQASSNRARASCRSRACPRCSHRALTDTPPTPSQASLPVGAGLARDAATAHSRTPRRRHRRQASSNRARAACRSRACPRYKRRALTDTPPTPSQASLPVGAGLARDAATANSRAPHRRHRRQACLCRSRACPRCRRRALAGTPAYQ